MLGQRVAELHLGAPVVVGIPRGGVVVAAQVADILRAPLDVLVARKVGAPRNPELAIGAVGPDDEVVLDDRLVAMVGASPAYLEAEIAEQKQEMRRRVSCYRQGRPAHPVKDYDVVLVDDGVATGYTVLAGLRALRRQLPRSVVLAVPVAPADTVASLAREADRVVCLATPEPFYAVGQFYSHFPQVSDEEVLEILRLHTPSERVEE